VFPFLRVFSGMALLQKKVCVLNVTRYLHHLHERSAGAIAAVKPAVTFLARAPANHGEGKVHEVCGSAFPQKSQQTNPFQSLWYRIHPEP
jgi:hypothetical protein